MYEPAYLSIISAIESLSDYNSYAFFDLHLSEFEISYLETLQVNTTDEYNNYGEHRALFLGIVKFLQNIGNDQNTGQSVAGIIENVVKEVVIASGKENAWIALRAFTQTNAYDLPRWHTDGNFYFTGDISWQYKFAICLKEASTLFYPLPGEMRDDFFAVQQKVKFAYNPGGSLNRETSAKLIYENRIAFDEMLNRSSSVKASLGQGAVSTVGSTNSAVHSEPPIREPRLFLSIVPGSTLQIEELYKRWHNSSKAQ